MAPKLELHYKNEYDIQFYTSPIVFGYKYSEVDISMKMTTLRWNEQILESSKNSYSDEKPVTFRRRFFS